MHWTSLFIATAYGLHGSTATPLQHQDVTRSTLARRTDITFNFRSGKKFVNATPLTQAKTVIPMVSSSASSTSFGAVRNALVSTNSTSLNAVEFGAGYLIDIDFGGERFAVIFDTGSSDLWLAQQGLHCVDYYNHSLDVSDCGFGPLYNGSIERLTYQNFNITYGDGEALAGIMGYQQICVGGIAVPHQEVALVTHAYWNGDNVSSGVMGFAYPSLTSAFEGTDPTRDQANFTDLPYTNWVFNAIAQHSMAPVFSVAISRGVDSGPSGQLALGGLPDIAFEDDWASSPLQILELTAHASEAKNYSYYTIIPDGFVLYSNAANRTNTTSTPAPPGSSVNTTFPVIVDSGTTLIYLPADLAIAVNDAFTPPAVYIENEGVFEADCDAVPPSLAIVIGGKPFEIDARDLLLPDLGTDSSTGGCLTGVQPIDDLYILGDSFLKNVVAVFDVGSSEMRFAARAPY